MIDITNKIKAQHLSKDKLHLNKRGSNVLSSTFIIELTRILNWERDKDDAGFIAEKCNSDKTNVEQSVTDCKKVLKPLRWNNWFLHT